ncbi:MAG: LacI family DNA-binding transcriptional regulator [Blastopirellula sp. JB062]
MTKPRINSTLSDVAKAAGVSASTASRALNGLAEKYRISPATAQLVKETAERLDFRPSQVARSLRLRRTGLLGIVVPDLSNPFFSAIARAVTVHAESEGFSALLADSDGRVEKERELIDQLVARNVESLIVCPIGLEFDHLERVHRDGVPLVAVDRCQADSDMIQVTSDHVAGARQAIELLLAHGHRRIGVLQGLAGTLPCDLRLQGVRQALHCVGLQLDPSRIDGDQFTEESGYRSTRRLLTQSPDVTALFAMSTPNAFGAIRAASELGLRIPADLSLISFDDVAFAEFMQTPLTTIAQDVSALGRRAASLVSTQIAQGKVPRQKMHKIPVNLISRTSIGKVTL